MTPRPNRRVVDIPSTTWAERVVRKYRTLAFVLEMIIALLVFVALGIEWR